MSFRQEIFLILLVLLQSCNSTKYVPEDKFLIKKNNIIFNGITSRDKTLYDLIIQKTNQRTLSLPLPLYFYNMGNINHEEDLEEWIEKHPKTINLLNKIFSYKKTKKLFETHHNLQNWFLKNGEPPVIFNKRAAEKTTQKNKTIFI